MAVGLIRKDARFGNGAVQVGPQQLRTMLPPQSHVFPSATGHRIVAGSTSAIGLTSAHCFTPNRTAYQQPQRLAQSQAPLCIPRPAQQSAPTYSVPVLQRGLDPSVDPTRSFVFRRTGKVVRNRTVLAAMTNRQSLADGRLSKAECNWLLMRAANGFGIVTTACAHVSREGQGFEGEVGVWDDCHVAGLSSLAAGLREQGAAGLVQIFHAGMRAPQHITGAQPISASVSRTEQSETGVSQEMSELEIRRVIQDFACAARRVAEAGFDGVELHGAHGYLICQFLSTETNTRRDAWGGSLQNRARFLVEIIHAVREQVPLDFLIGVRISPEYAGISLEDSIQLSRCLRDLEIDFLHLSCWDSFQRARAHPQDPRTYTEWFKSTVPDLPPIITAGEIWTPQHAQSVMQQGADFVAVARSAIGNPDWANRIGDPNYRPQMPPYSAAHLQRCGLSDIFIHYMRNWKEFVAP